MKKILLTIVPSLLTYIYIFIDSYFPNSEWILVGIYILFPIMFIVQTIISFNSIKGMLIGFLLLSLSIMLPINEWYRMGSMIPAIVIYIILSVITYSLIILFKICNKKHVK